MHTPYGEADGRLDGTDRASNREKEVDRDDEAARSVVGDTTAKHPHVEIQGLGNNWRAVGRENLVSLTGSGQPSTCPDWACVGQICQRSVDHGDTNAGLVVTAPLNRMPV